MKKLHTSLALAALAATSLNRFANDSAVVEPTTSTDTAGGLTVTPVAKPEKAPKPQSKAGGSRVIMKRHTDENNAKAEADRLTPEALYEAIIAEMIATNGYDRQLARGTYKANYVKAGAAAPVEGKKPTKKADATAPAATTDAGAPAADATV